MARFVPGRSPRCETGYANKGFDCIVDWFVLGFCEICGGLIIVLVRGSGHVFPESFEMR